MNNPDLVHIFAERRRPSGKPLTGAVAEGLDLVEEALAWRTEDEAATARADAEATARLAKAARGPA